jgi:hypothetical protein
VLANAMRAAWNMAAALIPIDELADMLGERHRIVANDWQAATMSLVTSHLLGRAADILDAVDSATSPASTRSRFGLRA